MEYASRFGGMDSQQILSFHMGKNTPSGRITSWRTFVVPVEEELAVGAGLRRAVTAAAGDGRRKVVALRSLVTRFMATRRARWLHRNPPLILHCPSG